MTIPKADVTNLVSVMTSLRCAGIKAMLVSHVLIPDGLGGGGFDGFIGDHNKGWIAIKHFEDSDDIPGWFHKMGIERYPSQYPGA